MLIEEVFKDALPALELVKRKGDILKVWIVAQKTKETETKDFEHNRPFVATVSGMLFLFCGMCNNSSRKLPILQIQETSFETACVVLGVNSCLSIHG
ncbi:hypothetical protein CDAR_33491 [Caerostris darwini]|uniref:Uncharacterized protein n=1 Tax=Caerostris darwini TaxID=1538125 RepID=A0AAV4QL95_9ARAC|nr:hypothetical protein CDAR_33491 [Caerostris darwini]